MLHAATPLLSSDRVCIYIRAHALEEEVFDDDR